MKITRFALLIILSSLLAACSGQPAATTVATLAATAEQVATATANTAATENMDNAAPPVASAALPAWANIELVNAATGATFRLADFAGKTIYVEPMATWCSNCRRQLGNVNEAVAQLAGNADIVFIGLSVETELTAADLQDYVARQGFNFPFAVATPAMMQQLIDQFGRTVSNPPSTPHFVIRPDGTVSELKTGFEDAAAIVALVQGG
jgi:peroxiredoxin